MSATIRDLLERSQSEYTDLYLSLGFIVGTLLAAELVRLCVKWILKDPHSLTRRVILECLASGELVSACFEVCVSKYEQICYILSIKKIKCISLTNKELLLKF